tara:strand:+ start:1252 stop:2475 length:1224 start_codon:yes stop_codon:yes gene_type:complete
LDNSKNCQVIGISYKNADLDTRGLFSLSDLQLHSLYLEAKEKNFNEILIINTCNRTEIFGWNNNTEDFINLLCKHSNGDVKTFEKYGYIIAGNKAIKHLYTVGTGLDSQILGDFEIIGQIKQSLNRSKRLNLVSGRLERLVNSVIHASKKIKNQTKLSSGATSVAYASVQYIIKNVKNISKKKIVLFGVGKIGRNTCENLLKHTKNEHIVLINRTQEKAEKIAVKFPVLVKPYGELTTEVSNADVLIVATSGSKPTITKDLIFNSKNLLILDLSIPRNVETQITELNDIKVVHLDELSQITDSTIEKRKKHIPKAKLIINSNFKNYILWLSQRKFSPTLKSFKEQVTQLKKEKLNCPHNNFFSDKAEEIAEKITGQVASFLKENPNKVPETIDLINKFLKVESNKNE